MIEVSSKNPFRDRFIKIPVRRRNYAHIKFN